MHPQDVAHDQLLAGRLRRGDHLLRLGHRHGHRLFQKHVAAGGEGPLRVGGVGVGVGVDRDGVGLRGNEGLFVIRELGVLGAHGREQLTPRGLSPCDNADDLKLRQCVVGLGMRRAHVAAAHDEDPDGLGHGEEPFSSGSRECMTRGADDGRSSIAFSSGAANGRCRSR